MKNWIVILRVFATISVVILHSISSFLKTKDYENLSWFIFNGIDSFVRSCVPIFVMITGYLLLGKETEVLSFYKKRIGKIIYPFLFWSFICLPFQLIYLNKVVENFKNIFFIEVYKLFIKGTFYHLWYLYMLIGLYLIIPYIQKWINKATNKEICIFIVLWFITLLYNKYTIDYLPGVDLSFMQGYIGYLVLGYYLGHRITLTLVSSLVLIAIGWIITFIGTVWLFSKGVDDNLFFTKYLTLNVALLSMGFFSMFKLIAIKPGRILLLINDYSFGIYLCHAIYIQLFYVLFFKSGYVQNLHNLLGAVLIFVCTICMSLITVYLMRRSSFFSKFT